MATFKSSTFGPISGRHGNAVAAVRKDGLCILKEYVKPSNPNTPKQQAQRDLFRFAMTELNCLRKIFTITFDGQYGINRALSLAMKTSIEGEFPYFSLNHSKLLLSNGKLENLALLEVSPQVETTLKLEWNTDMLLSVSKNDKVNMVFLNPATKFILFKQNITDRAQGSLEVELPAIWKELTIHGWLYLASSAGKSFSTSQYLGLIQL